MFSQGYRLDGANQHVSVEKFVELHLDKKDNIIFNRMLHKRNSPVYGTAGSITESEAMFALREAEDLVEKIFAIIDKS